MVLILLNPWEPKQDQSAAVKATCCSGCSPGPLRLLSTFMIMGMKNAITPISRQINPDTQYQVRMPMASETGPAMPDPMASLSSPNR